MNRITNILYIAILVVIMSSCDQLSSVDEISPEYVLTDETAFINASSTEAVLNGVYQLWRGDGVTQMRNAMFQLTRTTLNTNVARAYEFKVNDISVSSPLVKNYYQNLYKIVNQAGSIITLLPKVTPKELSNDRKMEILGEAYFNRALANFMLLRSFGEFWDIQSQYGIVLYDVPVRENKAQPRSIVSKCYKLINSDLENAILYCPEYTVSYRANKIAAKLLRARLALYQNDYSKVLSLCDEIEKDALNYGISLDDSYKNIYLSGYNSSELLFSIYTSYPQEIITTGLYNDFYFNGIDGTTTVRIADELVGGIDDGDMFSGENMDPRYCQIYNWTENGCVMNKYLNNINGEDANPYYILRYAEMYLLRAEAQVRIGKFNEARNSLKHITTRAGYDEDYTLSIADSDLLLKIFQHKYIEFNGENYEEWFDMVRFNHLDGINFENLEYIRSFKHKTLPIPYDALAGNNQLIQNPDYIYKE